MIRLSMFSISVRPCLPPPKFACAHVNSLLLVLIVRRRWKKVVAKGETAQGRWGHTAVIHSSKMFVFGGFNDDGYSNQLFVLDLSKLLLPLSSASHLTQSQNDGNGHWWKEKGMFPHQDICTVHQCLGMECSSLVDFQETIILIFLVSILVREKFSALSSPPFCLQFNRAANSLSPSPSYFAF